MLALGGCVVTRLGGGVSFICVFSIRSNGPGKSPSTNGLPHISTRANVNLIASIYLGHGIHGCIRMTGDLTSKCSVFVGRGTILGGRVSGTRSSSRIGDTGSGATTTHLFVYGGCCSVHAFNTMVSAKGGTKRMENPVRLAFTHSMSSVTATRRSVAQVTITARGRTRGRGNSGEAVNHGTAIPCNLCIYRNFVSTGLTGRANFSRRSLRLFFSTLGGVFSISHSTTENLVDTRGLVMFGRSSVLNGTPTGGLFSLIGVREGPSAGPSTMPESFGSCGIAVSVSSIPDNMAIRRLV